MNNSQLSVKTIAYTSMLSVRPGSYVAFLPRRMQFKQKIMKQIISLSAVSFAFVAAEMGGVRVCGDAVLCYFWCGFGIIFVLTCGIAVSKH